MKLGDIELTRIGLGTNRLTNTPENRAFVRAAVKAGVNFIDTAHLYTGGESEQTLGEAFGGAPDGVVVATKGGYHSGRAETIRAELETSLQRLQTDTIELYYLHRVDRDTPIEDSLAVIKEYQEAGRIRHAGISEVSVEQIERARQVLPIAAVQNHYNLVVRGSDDVLDYCAEEGILFVPYFPLRDQNVARLEEIARAHGATSAQITLAWLLHRSSTTLPIPGTLSIEHLRENLGALDIALNDEDVRALR